MINTYVTVQEADDYVQKYYPPELEKEWRLRLNEPKKEICLRQAFTLLKGLFLRPWDGDTPQEIKYAQIELAVYPVLYPDEYKQYSEACRGVQSFTVGSFSESYDSAKTGRIYSAKAKAYLRKWLCGSCQIS